jgi:NitT/TauT family transport system permease protein
VRSAASPFRLEWLTAPGLFLVLLLLWQGYVAVSGISPFILPPPLAVGAAFAELVAQRATWFHVWLTVGQTLGGFAAAVVFGVVLGLLVGRVFWLERTLTPFVVAMQMVPKVALVPLFIVWFGFGPESKLLISGVMSFFPVFTSAVLGVKSVEPGHRDVMTSLNATPSQRLWHLELPSALPVILSGMEVGIVLATIGCVVAQLVGGNAGLGYLLVARMNAYETDGLFAVIALLAAMGYTLHLLLRLLRGALIGWHHSVVS